MIEVTSKVKVYERDGNDVPIGKSLAVEVKSHGNYDDRVILVLPDGSTITVVAKDMRAAINNATNSVRF